MFPYGTSALYSGQSMAQYQNQNQQQSNHQNFPYVGTPEMIQNHHNQGSWSLSHEVQMLAFPSYAPLYSPVQYAPEPVPFPKPYHSNVMAKRHQATITLAPTKSGNFKTIVKRKRKRTAFTTEQVEALESIYKRKPYISRDEREVIVKQLQINDKAVKTWFQNRRLKNKKQSEQIEEKQVTVLSPRSSPIEIELDSVESKIKDKVDPFGYVALDDSLIKDLFTVIDGVLTDNTPKYHAGSVSEQNNEPIYEPISPASCSDSNEDEPTWQPSEPNESLQILFDLQSMFST